MLFEILTIITLIGQLNNYILDSLIHAPCPQVLNDVWILIISFMLFEILTITTLIGQLTN